MSTAFKCRESKRSQHHVLSAGAIVHTAALTALAYVLPSSLIGDVHWFAFVGIVVLGSTAEAAMTADADNSQASTCRAHQVATIVGLVIMAGFIAAHVERFVAQRFVAQRSDWIEEASGLPSLGIALLMIGFGIRLWAIATIGRDFQTAIVAPSHVATGGPYRWARHPGELGMVLLAVGGPIALGANVTALSVLLLISPLAIWRIRQENRMLGAIIAGPAKQANPSGQFTRS